MIVRPGRDAADQADDAGRADRLVNLVAERAQPVRDDARGAVLAETEFGMHVEIAPDEDDVVGQALRER